MVFSHAQARSGSTLKARAWLRLILAGSSSRTIEGPAQEPQLPDNPEQKFGRGPLLLLSEASNHLPLLRFPKPRQSQRIGSKI